MTRCLILATGGTIASTSKGGYIPDQPIRRMVALLPRERWPHVEIESEQVSNILSHAMTPDGMLRLAKRIQEYLADPCICGVVVTHGTVTMEESAFLCDLVTPAGKPVVFTGSMTPAGHAGGDGMRNLTDAIQLCVSRRTGALGVVVCMAGYVHAARWARKLRADSNDAFLSPQGRVLGRVDEPLWMPRELLDARRISPGPLERRVDFVSAVSGMDDKFIVCADDHQAKGVVIEGLPGAGSITPLMAAALPRLLKRGTVVVLTSRSTSGPVRPASGGVGGSYTLNNLGVIMGGRLSGPKVRILLMVALGARMNRAQIADLIARYGSVREHDPL